MKILIDLPTETKTINCPEGGYLTPIITEHGDLIVNEGHPNCYTEITRIVCAKGTWDKYEIDNSRG